MKRILAATAVAGLAITFMAACSPDNANEAASSTPASAASSTVANVSALSAIKAAGATCKPGQRAGEFVCTLDGVEVTVSDSGWESQADTRAQACEGGYINAAFEVVTDGSWWAMTDMVRDLAAVKSALAVHGAVGDIKAYCPEGSAPSTTDVPTTTVTETVVETPTMTTPETRVAPHLPESWDKDNNGMIDTDAPIG